MNKLLSTKKSNFTLPIIFLGFQILLRLNPILKITYKNILKVRLEPNLRLTKMKVKNTQERYKINLNSTKLLKRNLFPSLTMILKEVSSVTLPVIRIQLNLMTKHSELQEQCLNKGPNPQLELREQLHNQVLKAFDKQLTKKLKNLKLPLTLQSLISRQTTKSHNK